MGFINQFITRGAHIVNMIPSPGIPPNMYVCGYVQCCHTISFVSCGKHGSPTCQPHQNRHVGSSCGRPYSTHWLQSCSYFFVQNKKHDWLWKHLFFCQVAILNLPVMTGYCMGESPYSYTKPAFWLRARRGCELSTFGHRRGPRPWMAPGIQRDPGVQKSDRYDSGRIIMVITNNM